MTWSSLAGKTYSVYRSSDMLTWELAANNISSMGDTFTTWLDPTVPSPSPDVQIRFYRIIEEEEGSQERYPASPPQSPDRR